MLWKNSLLIKTVIRIISTKTRLAPIATRKITRKFYINFAKRDNDKLIKLAEKYTFAMAGRL